jgi:hypothetical protein
MFWNMFYAWWRCRPLPIELPTDKEWRIDASQIDGLKTVVSPVFYSTSENGDIMRGLDALGLEAGKPVLLVGNHQTIPVDIAPLVEGVCSFPFPLAFLWLTFIFPLASLYLVFVLNQNRSSNQNHLLSSKLLLHTLHVFFGFAALPALCFQKAASSSVAMRAT